MEGPNDISFSKLCPKKVGFRYFGSKSLDFGGTIKGVRSSLYLGSKYTVGSAISFIQASLLYHWIQYKRSHHTHSPILVVTNGRKIKDWGFDRSRSVSGPQGPGRRLVSSEETQARIDHIFCFCFQNVTNLVNPFQLPRCILSLCPFSSLAVIAARR